MKNKILLVIGAALCGLSLQCFAQGVVLSNEYGCQNLDDQKARGVLIGDLQSFAPEDIVRQDANKAALRALNESKCQPLTGQFALVQEVDGLRQVESSAGIFWLLE
jgi:hypothetical protein